MHTWFWWANLKERDHLEDVCVDGRIILGCMFNKCDWGGGGMDWFDVAQNRDRWHALTNAVMYFWLSQNAGNFLTS